MSKIDIIGELYSPLLAALHVTPDTTGVLRRIHGDNVKICEVNKRKLVLPTNDNLKSLSNDDYMFFHPLSENFARGDSAIFNFLKTLIALRVNYSIIGLASVLLSVAADKQLDGKFNSQQLELLTAIPKVDKKTVDVFINASSMTDLDKNVFFSVYNRRNGKINGATFNRVAVVRFPLIEQLREPSQSNFWNGVKNIRKADLANYLSLMNYILPNWDIENSYSGYSDSMEAPSFHALVMAFVAVMKRITHIATIFSNIAEVEDIGIANIADIEAAINQLPRYANIISPLDGNIGEVAAKDTPVNKIQNNPIGVPPASLLDSADNKLNQYNNAPAAAPAPQPQQPAYPQQQPQQPNNGFIGFPQQQPAYPYYPQQQQPQPAYPQHPPQNGYPAPGGFITYPPQQPVYPNYPQQQQQPMDALAQWQQQFSAPQQPAYPAYPQGFPQQQPAYPYYPQQQQPQPAYPPQGYYPQQPQQPQFFRRAAENTQTTGQSLPPTFQGK